MSGPASWGILRVDLTAGTVGSERVPDRWVTEYLGGKGLGVRYLYDHLDPGVDPLGPDNALLFVIGPLSGLLPGEQRYAAVTKSPLTGTFLDSYAGGSFPGVLAGALEDHLGVFVTGGADEPVCLTVENGEGSLEPADEWGLDAVETARAFPDAAVACVGPAGEHRVEYATIASDEADHHAGRGGAGAVMGAKRLKAVVARGDPPDPSPVDSLREAYADRFVEDDTGRWLSASATLETVDFANQVGALATRGWQESRFEGADAVGIESVREAATGREREDDPVPGGFRVETDEGESVPRGGTPMTLGAGLGIDEFDAVAELGQTCDRLGMDVISGGNAVAWAIRATEEGIVDRDIDFGDPDAARALLEEIAARSTPLGDALADGVDAAADRFGVEGEALIPTVKRMELPAYDPRQAPSMALAYATSDRGACHRRARPIEREAFSDEPWSPERAARVVAGAQNARSLLWSLVADDFFGDVLQADMGAEWLAAVGIEQPPEQLRRTGERIWNLTRLFNLREGFTRADDRLPALLRGQGTAGMGSAGSAGSDRDAGADADASGGLDPELFEAMLDAYYAIRGWDDKGRPTRATLDRLELLDVVDDETPVSPSS